MKIYFVNVLIDIFALLLCLMSVQGATRQFYRGATSCPNLCSGNGVCMNATLTSSAGECSCFPGFHGYDCSIRLCPAGKAWVDFPSAANRAHADFVECSNMGYCDRETGECLCREGYSGAACDMMLCPMGDQQTCVEGTVHKACGYQAVCSGNGRCLPLRDAAEWVDYVNLFDNTEYTTKWDADMIHGCVCDPGWEGPSCDRRSCPKGDDPTTDGQIDEVQLLDCKCYTCAGGIYISFRGRTTNLIPYSANENVVRHFLEELGVMELFSVNIMDGRAICSSAGSTTRLVVQVPSGPQDAMIITTANTFRGDVKVYTGGRYSRLYTYLKSYSGTKENSVCSNQGVCDYSTGMCSCFPAFMSSNGAGALGLRGDCGYRRELFIDYWISSSTTVNSSCPVIDGQICSGHGDCTATFECYCNAGYTGGACHLVECPNTNSWFGDVGSNHDLATPCSGVGICNTTVGTCYDCGGPLNFYTGDNCEYLSCYTDALGNECSGNGRCLSLREIAPMSWTDREVLSEFNYTTPWDADMVRGCTCEKAVPYGAHYEDYYNEFGEAYTSPGSIAVFNQTLNVQTNQYYNKTKILRTYNTKFYRGPYGFAVTDFTGYSCSHAKCPLGDDPQTGGDVNEIQQVFCRATNGTFTLSFRNSTTMPISWNDTLTEFKAKLEAIPTIRSVAIWVNNFENVDYKWICNATRTGVFIEFLSEPGDLPLMEANSTYLQWNDYHYSHFHVNVTEYQAGTKESLECSARGICNEVTGVCSCSPGLTSSNGTVGFPGHMGDCSYLNPLFPPLAKSGNSYS